MSEIITLIYELLLPLEVRMRWRDAGALLTSLICRRFDHLFAAIVLVGLRYSTYRLSYCLHFFKRFLLRLTPNECFLAC